MLIKVIDKTAAKESEVTPYSIYVDRRRFMEGVASTAALIGTGTLFTSVLSSSTAEASVKMGNYKKGGAFNTDEPKTPQKDVTSYNNFYEFGTDKSEPAQTSGKFKTDPWKVEITGLVEKPQTLDLADLMKPYALEERIYRLRCVEGWSMVIPWIGFPLADLIKTMKPTSKAKYVEFVTLNDPKQMPGQKSRVLDWPYVEGLRLDEAMHPLTLMAVGLYGEPLPNQNGAPLRLVVPWKYGFKSIKSIVKINFTDKQPATTWNKMASEEYGFYANVNPKVDHPRWTQSKERRIGEFFKRDTKMFNGYDSVASLYKDLDLRKNY